MGDTNIDYFVPFKLRDSLSLYKRSDPKPN